ncbi:hypothetical protein [Kitasatospora sp. NBC_01300]|uniref:hypothetical protein n=1 Tax=Kitasatospora sp. NBC_01300 TaxID=2903574 RepID=UPI00352C61C1|nr:hypothetical protein OG556_40475 [Kitasatospora sp. NBC_01300]
MLYRTTLTIDCTDPEQQPDIFKTLRGNAAAWLDSKGYGSEALGSSGQHQLDASTTLDVVGSYSPDGDEVGLRLQFIEQQAQRWTTTLTAVGPDLSGTGLVAIDLECHTGGTIPPSGPPRIIRELVAALPVIDGLAPDAAGGWAPITRLTVSPQHIAAADVDDLLEVLTHQDRRRPVIVAARPHQESPLWTWRTDKAWDRAAGFASLYLLTDQAAVTAFQREIGPDHWVAPGAVRTYLPGVDPAWAADRYRHRFLTYQRLNDRRDEAWRHIASSVQEHTLDAPVPERLAGLVLLNTSPARLPHQRPEMPSPIHLNPAEARSEVSRLTGMVSTRDEEISRQQRMQLSLQHQLNDANAKLTTSEANNDSELAQHLDSLDLLDRANREIDRLRVLLMALDAGTEAYAQQETEDAPRTFEEVLDRITSLPGVQFTGDRPRTLRLDDSDTRKVPGWARKAWLALQALSSYAEISTSEGFKGNFREFCLRSPRGAVVISGNTVAMVESEETLNQWANERMLPVPKLVHTEGKILMEAHIKLDVRGSISPRIHFYDDTAGPTGKVLVGLIARHLTNTKT